jgi:8-oxo-dGTP pyrophosphatase MutT (NUDIX family)
LDEKPTLTSITGGVNEKQDPLDVAVQEMYEEAGYLILPNQLMAFGKVYLAKGADFVGHLYAIDVTGIPRIDAPGDGSKGEQGAYCDWVSVSDALSCKDPVMGCMILRAIVSNMEITL